MTLSLPPPIAGTAVTAVTAGPSGPTRPTSSTSTLPVTAAVGAIAVLSISLFASKYLLDVLVDFQWPVAVYVALLAVVGYGPSVWFCWFASRRWGTGDLGHDIGFAPRLADLAWGPLIWLGAIGAQVAVGAFVVALGVPITGNTDGIDEISADRTYVVSLVITAVIAAPIVEEMVFRGVVMRGLRSRFPLVIVIIAQGLLFGAAHVDPVRGVGNVGLVLVLSGVGIAFGVAVTLLGRIGPSIVAHAIFNGAVLLIVLTGVADRLREDAQPSTVEQIGVVDQADVADVSSDCDANLFGLSVVCLEALDRVKRDGVEHRDVVQLGERLVVDDLTCGGDHVVDADRLGCTRRPNTG